MKKILFFTIFCMLCQAGFCQLGKIIGHVIDTVKNENMAYADIELLGTKIKTKTDTNGIFTFENLKIDTYHIHVWSRGYVDTILYDIKVATDSIISLKIKFPTFCKYNGVRNQCPKCKKKINVIPIIYGYPNPSMRKKADKGKLKLGGCIISECDPNWYCTKDRIEF